SIARRRAEQRILNCSELIKELPAEVPPVAHPRMYDESDPAIKKLREVCLGLGGVIEKEAWGECTFRAIGGSMFAMTDNNHHNSGHVAVWVKAPAMVQEILINSDERKFFKPPYMGHK